MNKKVIPTLVGFAIIIGLVATLSASLYNVGVHRPSLAFKVIPKSTFMWLGAMALMPASQHIMPAATGPFNWDNKDDLAQSGKAGKWAKEENAYAVVYYRKDKDAIWQSNARTALQELELIVRDLTALMDSFPSREKMNGRKLPVYLPSCQEEYDVIIDKLSEGAVKGGNNFGCSIMNLGPLGCQTKGIVIHPAGFKQRNKAGDLRYIKALRRELCHYAYYSSLRYDKEFQPYMWFSEGLAEFFAVNKAGVKQLPEKYVNFIVEECNLTKEFPSKDNSYQWGGCSFFQYFSSAYGMDNLKQLVGRSLEMSTPDLFASFSLDPAELKRGWEASLGVQVAGVEPSAADSLTADSPAQPIAAVDSVAIAAN